MAGMGLLTEGAMGTSKYIFQFLEPLDKNELLPLGVWNSPIARGNILKYQSSSLIRDCDFIGVCLLSFCCHSLFTQGTIMLKK